MTPVWAQSAIDITPRGFTGHEHVDEMGIIHMNGRIYDALLGRFLQADPFVEDSTTLNRYTYVHNNPLSITDPSGFFSFKKAFRTIASIGLAVAAGIITQNYGLTVKGFLAAVVGGAAAGGVAAGSIEGALWGAFSGAVFFGIGQHFAGSLGEGQGVFGSTFKSGELVRASVAHGLAGGTISEMQGGKFGHGFLSAGISKAATPMAVGVSDQVYIQGAAIAIVGGTTSEISGGKFANGAVTAAMAFAFNQVAHESQSEELSPEDKFSVRVTAGLKDVLEGGVIIDQDGVRRVASLRRGSEFSLSVDETGARTLKIGDSVLNVNDERLIVGGGIDYKRLRLSGIVLDSGSVRFTGSLALPVNILNVRVSYSKTLGNL